MTRRLIATGAIYVDDSGNPGVESGSDFLPSSRKSWTAVIVPSVVAKTVQEGMDILLNGVHGEFGVRELHFTEIFSRTGLWKDVPVGRRAEIFKLMAEMMAVLGLPIVHQTVADFTRADHPENSRPFRTGDWNTEDLSHFGLLVLCSEVSRHIRTMRRYSPQDFSLPFPLYADEGILPAGKDRALPNWADVIEGPKVCFRDSADLPGLQMADFAAFVIMRSQWIAVTRKPGPITKPEEIILNAAAGLNILNFTPQIIPINEFGRAGYEKQLAADRIAKGLAPHPPRAK